MENKIYKCEKCEKDKNFNEMAKDKNRPDGIRKKCKKCENDRIKAVNKKSRELAKSIGVTYNTKIKNDKIDQILKNTETLIKLFSQK
jgi:NAD-dependent SIR2 family protein deacetylase